jgi:hypothetical protein
MAISGTYGLVVDPQWKNLVLQEIYLECDTTLSPITINLFPISDLGRFWNVKIYVTDISNNAGANPITINADGFDTINRQGVVNFTIDYNGGDATLFVVSENKWSAINQTILAQTGLTFKGAWDANSNTPTLTSGVGVGGDYYIVSVAGNTNLDGTIDWQVGDWAIFEGTTNMWQKIDNHDVQAYNTVQNQGVALPQRSIIDFQGSGVTATDNGAKTIVTVPIQPAYATIQEEGGSLTQQPIIDFQGSGVTATNGSGKTIVTVPIQPAYATIQEEGSSLPQRSVLNFTGAGVTAFDNAGKTEVNVSGVSSGNFGLYSQTASSIPVTNTIIETSLLDGGVGTLSVPPNGFNVGDSFLAIMTGHLNSANNQQLEIRIRSNGSILADTGSLTINTATNQNFNLQIYFTIQSIGGLGVASIVTGGNFVYTKNASSSLEGTAFSTVTNTTFNTTVLNTLLITAQWGASNPNNSIYSEIFTLTKTF